MLPAAKEKADGAPPAAAKIPEPVVLSPDRYTVATSTPRPTESPSLADALQAVKKTLKAEGARRWQVADQGPRDHPIIN